MITVFLLAAASLTHGCTPSVPASETVRVGCIGNLTSLSPIYDRSPLAMGVQSLYLRGFLDWSADGGLRADWATAVPSLRNHTFRGNGQFGAYTMTLRPDAKWSDGTPLTNDDFMFTYRVMLHPLFKTGHTWWTAPIRGFREAGPSLTFEVARSTTHDGLDLFPLPRHLLENQLNRDAVHFSEQPFNAGSPLGDGPYKVVKASTETVDLERNALYSPHPPQLSRVVVQLYPSADDAWAALKRGAIDLIDNVPLDTLGSLPDGGSLKVETTPGPRLVALTFNTTRAPFDDVHVRRALAQSVDRNALVRNVERAIATDSWMQPTRSGYLPSFGGYRGDLGRARGSLRASAWTVDKGRLVPAKRPPQGDDPPPPIPSQPANDLRSPSAQPALASAAPSKGSPGEASSGDASSPGAASAAPSSVASEEPSSAATAAPTSDATIAPGSADEHAVGEIAVLFDGDSADMKSAITSLQKSWDSLGLKLIAVGRPHASYLAEMRQGAFAVALQEMEVYPWAEPAAWFSVEGIPTPANNFKGDNVSRWSSEESKKLLARIAAEACPADAPQALHEQERLVVADVPMLPLYFTPLAVAHRSGLEGLKPRTFGPITWNIEEWNWK